MRQLVAEQPDITLAELVDRLAKKKITVGKSSISRFLHHLKLPFSPGLVSSEALAAAFGLTAIPSDQGGTNYATSGAKNVTINNAATGGFQAAIPTVTQIDDYLAANGGRADANALYLISSGGNDISFATGNSGIGPYPANPRAYIVSAANSLAGAIANLQAAGARYIVVPDLPYSFLSNRHSTCPTVDGERQCQKPTSCSPARSRKTTIATWSR